MFQLIRRFSSANVEFAGLALTLAHELAEDAVLRGKSWLLGHALEIVATVATSPLASSSCYKDWFQAHFGNNAAENTAELKAGDDAWRCIKSSKGGTSEACRLIRSKSHLQLVCLFLLEFDRRDNWDGAEGVGSTADRVVWTSTYVMTHLSVLKSFQGQNSPENALVIEFCAEARVCYASLLSREQAGREPSSAKCSPSTLDNSASAIKRPNKYSSEARAVVDESVTYYKTHQRLPPQLKQWKTFQYLKWKSDILPCCLDVTIDENWAALDAIDPSSDQNSDVVDQIHFVFALARANMVPADDYARFLAKIQSWVDQTRATIARDMQRKRQRDVASSLHRSIRRLRRICQCATVVADKPRKALLSECLASVSESVFAYLDSHAAHVEVGNAADVQSRQERMVLLWTSAFMEVLGAIGVDGLDEFYAFQISLLVKFGKAAARWSTFSSERNTFPEELCSIALTHRPSTGTGVDAKHVVEWIACFAGVVAGMFAATKQQPTPVIPTDVLCEFSVMESAMAAREWPGQELLVEKTLLFTCFLQALASLQTTNPEVDVHIACTHAFPAHAVDLWAWMAYRVWRESHWKSSIEAVVSAEAAEARGQGQRGAIDWIRQGQRALLHTKWLETFRERWRLTETVKNMLDYEFRCGSASRGALSSALRGGDAEWTPASTLQRHLEIVDATGASQPPVYWCEWLIDEILSLAAAQPSKSDTNTERAAHEGLQAAILLLNDLIHRSLQSSGQISDIKRSLMSQWLELVAHKLSAIDEQAVASKQMLYRYSSEILNVLRGLNNGEPTLPQLQSVHNNRLMELMRGVAHDLRYTHVSAYVRRFLLRPLLELAMQRHAERGWGMQNATEMPIELLVEWGQLRADSSKGQQVETKGRDLLAMIEWLGRTITTMVSVGVNELSTRPKSTSLPVESPASSPTTVSSIFTAASEGLKFLVQATRFVLDSSHKGTAMAQDDSQRRLSTCLQRMAKFALDACSGTNWGAAPSHGPAPDQHAPIANGVPRDDGDAVHTLVPWLFEEWRGHVTGSRPRGNPLLFQLFLLHLTAMMCARSAHASKKLLESLTNDEVLRAVFAVLVASVASDSNQLGAILARNSSLWVNAFPDAALVAVSRPSSGHKSTKGFPANTLGFEETLGGTASFRARASALVGVALTYGAEHQVDLLTASLKPRVAAQWPHLESLTARLPVLSLDGDMVL